MFYLNSLIKKSLSSGIIILLFFGFFIPTTHSAPNPIYKFEKTGGSFFLESNEYTFKPNEVLSLKATLNPSGKFSLKEEYPYLTYPNRDYNRGIRGFLFIDTDQLPDDGDLQPIMTIKTRDDLLKDKSYLLHGVGIYYDPELDHIFAFAGNSNKTYDGDSARYVLFENITKQTPDFMMFVWLTTFNQYKGSNRDITQSYGLVIFRETEVGNGIIRSGDSKDYFLGYDDVKYTNSNPTLYLSPNVEFATYSYLYNSNNVELTPQSLCSIFSDELSFTGRDTPEYRSCIQAMSDQINFAYLDAWRDKFGLWINNENINTNNGGDTTITGGQTTKFGMIEKIHMDKPNPPTCSFSDSFLGLSCLGEWLSYSFQNLIYFFISIYNGLVDFFNAIISFVLNFFKNLFDGIKGIFVWFWEGIKNFLEPVIKPIYDFFVNAHKIISENISDLQKISFTGTMETCREFNEIDEKQATIASSLVNLISLAIPFAPADGGEVCTFDGRKIVDYKENTKFLDTILIMSAFMSIIFTFTSGISKHD